MVSKHSGKHHFTSLMLLSLKDSGAIKRVVQSLLTSRLDTPNVVDSGSHVRMFSWLHNAIPGWDVEMDIARDKSKFCHSIFSECGREHTGIVYDIMKKARSRYHYLLRALKKKKHYKTKLSISKSMLRSDKTCYWKASRAIRKSNFNCTNVMDGVEGGSEIVNLFKDKYERLFNSVKCSEVEHNLVATNIDLEAESYCKDNEKCKESECTHCHVIRSSDVMSAIGKL